MFMMIRRVAGAVLAVALFAALARAQQPASTPSESAADAGIPVTNELVTAKCGTCHRPDAQKRLTRISYRRASPENWERTIKRMIQLNHLALEPDEARAIVKYLADNHGLAPEEARPVEFEAEHRLDPFEYTADKETNVVCSACHSIGRPMMERRTKAEWEGLVSMHRGYYPLVDTQPMNDGQGFRRTRSVTDPNGDKRHPMERIINHLASAYPLTTSAWADWSAARQRPMLAGSWALTGYLSGKGPLYGVVTITADPKNADTFVTDTKYTFARSGESVIRKGRGVVYTGFQWRGRSSLTTPNAAPWREVMFVERTQKEMWGRWFGGDYDELGMEVRLTRIGADPLTLGTSLTALKASSNTPLLRVYGANLPMKLTAGQISLGQGVTIARIVSSTPELLTLAVDVAPNALPGPRDLAVAGTHLAKALTVYDKVDSVRVMPQAGLARVGGVVFPKQFQQFEAIGFHNGPDKLPNTADDWSLGAMAATWSLEEYAATFDDDDVKFVGSLDANGLFTPADDGPNPKRKMSDADQAGRNNVGDVWVVATVAPDAARGVGSQLRARSQMVVSVPLYVNWLSSNVGK
jgi:quinohemoprotein amine dehydrogenase